MFIYIQNDLAGRKNQKDPMQPLGLLFFLSNKYVQHLSRLVASNLCKTYVIIFSYLLHPILLCIYQNNVCKHGLCSEFELRQILFKVIVILCVKSLSIPLCLLLSPLLPATTMAYIAVIRVCHWLLESAPACRLFFYFGFHSPSPSNFYAFRFPSGVQIYSAC